MKIYFNFDILLYSGGLNKDKSKIQPNNWQGMALRSYLYHKIQSKFNMLNNYVFPCTASYSNSCLKEILI